MWTGTANNLRPDLVGLQGKLRENEAALRTQTRLTAAGLGGAALLAGSAEFVPSQLLKVVMDLGAIGLGFLTAVGPGLDVLQMKFEFVNPGRREVKRIKGQIQERLLAQPELDLELENPEN